MTKGQINRIGQNLLKAIQEKYEFEFEDEKLIDLAKKVKIIVDDKAKYTDWSSKSNIRAR